MDAFSLKGKITVEEVLTMEQQLAQYYKERGCEAIMDHCREVALQARALARRYGIPVQEAQVAAYLHDLGRVIPEREMVDKAQEMKLYVLSEEKEKPMLLHQRLSRALAQKEFHVEHQGILGAIECHTTLRPRARPLDLILLVADKLSWPEPPREVEMGLKQSLRHAAFAYLKLLLARKEEGGIVHPWAVAAYCDLKNNV